MKFVSKERNGNRNEFDRMSAMHVPSPFLWRMREIVFNGHVVNCRLNRRQDSVGSKNIMDARDIENITCKWGFRILIQVLSDT